MTYETQLVLGVIATVLWLAAIARWVSGHDITGVTAAAFLVALVTMLVILVFGSLTLLGALDATLWLVVGTGGRVVVVVAGVVALIHIGERVRP